MIPRSEKRIEKKGSTSCVCDPAPPHDVFIPDASQRSTSQNTRHLYGSRIVGWLSKSESFLKT